ncbi:MAG: HEPN domain-containing protein [Dehalococcoidia bacterium]
MSARDEELAREWFDKAERDRLTADTMLSITPPPTDVVCFHYQQVAEKYLKGFLAWHGTPLIKTHDLADLLTQCCVVEPRLVSLQPLAVLLTDYAVDVRYPGLPHSDPTDEETSAVRDAAREIRRAVRTGLSFSA